MSHNLLRKDGVLVAVEHDTGQFEDDPVLKAEVDRSHFGLYTAFVYYPIHERYEEIDVYALHRSDAYELTEQILKGGYESGWTKIELVYRPKGIMFF